MLEAQNISYWYRSKDEYLYKDVNLQFEPGKMTAIIGSSGSGKTTFLSLLAGLDKPKAGKILWQGQEIGRKGLTNFRKNEVSIVFQAYNLLPYMTAKQNVLAAMEISNTKQADRSEYALAALASIGISNELANRKVVQLSGGQQQRVAIARAMCCNHDLIVADEPTGNLDEQTSQEIIELFQTVAHKQNKCVIIVTHEQQLAGACDIVYELKDRQFVKQ